MNALPPNSRAVRTTCPYCGVGCGILALPDGKGGATISGDPVHPANFGRLCSKGAALGETLSLDQRLLHPMLRQADGSLARVDWDKALDTVAGGLRAIVDRDGPGAIAFYLSGQLLTEDYYVANKLMKGFLGSANVDTNSRLCMASSVAGQRRAFGADTVPGIYRDLDDADLVVLVGSNAAWCHPVLYQRIMAAKSERGTKLIVIDPRRTATAEDADLFLSIAPGMDTALFCGLLVHLAETQALDRGYIDRYTTGFDETLARRLQDRRRRDRNSARNRPCQSRRRAILRAFPRHGTRRHLLLARRQSIRARHRQGERHHQRSSCDRPHWPPRHGTVFTYRAAERHGRTRSRRSRQSACRPYGFFAGRTRSRPPVLECAPACRPARASKPSICSRPSSAERSKRFGSWRPIRRCRCRAPARCAPH